MQELKCRVWSTLEDKMWSWEELTAPDSIGYLGEILAYPMNVEILLFTGLKDRTGREIFKGDIVRCQSNRGNNCLHAVTWEEARPFGDMGGWNLSKMAAKYDWIGKEEVIGNIYENPELLQSEA